MKKNFLTIMLMMILTVLFVGCAEIPESWRVGDFKGEYIGFTLENEDSENPIIIVRFEFTNNSSAPISFQKALNPTLSQQGSELIPIEESTDSALIDVTPGETFVIDKRFYLQSLNELVEIKITNYQTGETYSIQTHCEK